MSLPSAKEVEELIVSGLFTNASTESIQNVTKTIQQLSKVGESLAIFLEMVSTSQMGPVRQIAALLLNKNINTFFSRMDEDTQNHIKQTLIERMTTDDSKAVRDAIVSVAGSIAKHQLSMGNWNELLECMAQCAERPEAEFRQLGFELMYNLSNALSKFEGDMYQHIHDMLLKGLSDPELSVRVNALEASGNLMEQFDDEKIMTCKDLIPFMIEVMKACLMSDHEKVSSMAFQSFANLVAIPFDLFDDVTPGLARFVLEVAKNDDLDMDTRDNASMILTTLAIAKPMLFCKCEEGLVAECATVFMHLVAQFDPERAEDEEAVPWYMAETVLDEFSKSLPKRYFYPCTFEQSLQFIGMDNPVIQRAGLRVLGILADGCACMMEDNCDEIVNRIMAVAQSPYELVHEALLFCLLQLCQNLSSFTRHIENILPIAIEITKKSTPKTQLQGLNAIEIMLDEVMAGSCAEYAEDIMACIGSLLNHEDIKIRHQAVTTLPAAAQAGGEAFVQFLPTVAEVLMPLVNQIEDLDARGRAIDSWGHIAVTLGKEHFLPYFETVFNAAKQSFESEDKELMEYCYLFYGNMANLFKEEFGVHIHDVVPEMFNQLLHLDELRFKEDGYGGNSMGNLVNFDDDDDEEEDNEDNADRDEEDVDENEDHFRKRKMLEFNTAAKNLKCSLLVTLCELADHCNADMIQHLDSAFTVCEMMTENPDDDIRNNMAMFLRELTLGMLKARPIQNGVVHADIKDYLSKAVVLFQYFIRDDHYQNVACTSLVAIESLLKNVDSGNAIISNFGASIMQTLKVVFKGKTSCQRGHVEDEYDEEDHKPIIGSACDTFEGLAMVTKDAIITPIQEDFFELWSGLLQPTRSDKDRSAIVGLVGELCDILGGCFAEIAVQLIPGAIACLEVEEMEDLGMGRNACFAIGRTMQIAPAEATVGFVENALGAITAHMERGPEPLQNAFVDNGITALFFIMHNHPEMCPVDQLIPFVMNLLPNVEDHQEDHNILSVLVGLLEANALPELESVAGMIVRSLDPECEMEPEMKTQYAQLLSEICNRKPEIKAQLPAEVASRLA
eukprot:TRINITY_DN135_c1_g1_i3.p1 TRINITY_DN135_c1_g1~~TRINITY_DN135_c1_g1_i3.p1  ORF type:complete len:1069 (+),score=458.82 TRINITY_DN135_c1_g1_i3:79-3285(+)